MAHLEPEPREAKCERLAVFRPRADGHHAVNPQVRSGGRGIRTLEELAPLAVFKDADRKIITRTKMQKARSVPVWPSGAVR